MWLAKIVVVTMVLMSSGVTGRSSSGLVRLEKLLSSSSSTPLSLVSADHSVDKRAVFDQSCKGVYDRSLFQKLDRVCDDCYNLYRKSYVSTGCRENCYGNLVFRQCLDDLLLVDVVDEYVASVQMVGK
uniref:Hyperglycemic hormone A n=1 Tax=Panulirus homarus TaxID=150425 RepID=A0A6B9XL29_PANHM|nr:hyperglycemic hormone A [Panulirus homarus]